MDIRLILCYNFHIQGGIWMKFWKEFKEFAFKGNVIDLAVGVMIGSAFTSIVNSVVNDLFTPLFSLLTSGINFSSLGLKLGEGENAAVLAYGNFIQAVINFFLVAFCIFWFVKGINKLRSTHIHAKPEAPAKEKRLCPYCKSEIADDATRCPHCTSMLDVK